MIKRVERFMGDSYITRFAVEAVGLSLVGIVAIAAAPYAHPLVEQLFSARHPETSSRSARMRGNLVPSSGAGSEARNPIINVSTGHQRQSQDQISNDIEMEQFSQSVMSLVQDVVQIQDQQMTAIENSAFTSNPFTNNDNPGWSTDNESK